MKVKSIVKKIVLNIPGARNARLYLSAYRAPLSVIIMSKRAIKKYKDKYKGKRCFIIGNGPSLKAEDLDKLVNEYCFAANKIYCIYPQTKWRPTFYCAQDENFLRDISGDDIDLATNRCKVSIFRLHSYHKIKNKIPRIHNLLFVPITAAKKKNRLGFENNAEKTLYDGSTVTYMSMQLATYMGFSEIYLLGMDHSFPYIWTKDGELKVNDLSIASHFYDGAQNNIGENAWKCRSHNVETTDAYMTAYENCQKIGCKIYNASRGGALEVFPRVDFDSLDIE